MNFLQRFMQFFFKLLYHSFAFAYDLVAAIVSGGKWQEWVMSVVPWIKGNHVLEIGHGPGHLQHVLCRTPGLVSVAIDESASMGRLASRRLGSSHRLARALAQKIPFASDTFDTLISTFPSEYIFDAQTLFEAYRVLRHRGRLIVLLAVFPRNPLLGWLFKVTGQSPPGAYKSIKSKVIETVSSVNFKTEVELLEVKSSILFVVIAEK